MATVDGSGDAWLVARPLERLMPDGDRLLHQCHPHHRVRGGAPLVALVAAEAREGLVHRLAGDDPERAGDAGCELDLLDAARAFRTDVVVVVRLATDHHPETCDAGEAAGLRAPLGRDRQLEGARDLV